MTFVFWQNIISPHQFPYIKEVAKLDSINQVILIVSTDMESKRAAMGWNKEKSDKSEKLKIIINPTENQIQQFIIDNKSEYHFFSGLRATPMVYKAFKYSLSFEIKRFLIAEGPFYYKKPFILHIIKTLFFEKKHFYHFNKVFAIGHHATKWYKLWGFKDKQIIPFSYCVDLKSEPYETILREGRLKMVFIGALIHRKGLDLFLKALSKINGDYELNIIGDGPEKDNLKSLVKNYKIKNVSFLGIKNNKEVSRYLSNSDCLILPSRHDGWGAVVNEGLMNGNFILCSKNCGAKVLIQNNEYGLVFSFNKKNDLIFKINHCINTREQIRQKKFEIIRWSQCINAVSIAKYFTLSVISENQIDQPWRLN